MKQITFTRHAKSDWGTEFLQDADRHLNERGYRDAYFAAAWFAKAKTSPDLIISSVALRAYSTALIFARAMNYSGNAIRLVEDVYEAPASRLLSVAQRYGENNSHIMIFGHNPGMTNICNELGKELYFENVPTCGIVSFTFDTDAWAEIRPGDGTLSYYQFPKDFRNSA